VVYGPKMRRQCSYSYGKSALGKHITLNVKKNIPGRPRPPDFASQVVGHLRWALATVWKRRRILKGLDVWVVPAGMGLALEEPLEAPKPKVPRKAKNAEKAKKALERCEAKILETIAALRRLENRKKELTKRVRYYERVVREGPEFEAKLKELVASKWKEESDANPTT
jgi:hypothetical protein